jgi:Uma2 family endonuclease
MSTASPQILTSPVSPITDRVPPLHSGDRLTRDEFERRYSAAPSHLRAELVEGIVYVLGRLVSEQYHAQPHGDLVTWMGVYKVYTPGVQLYDNATVRLDNDNEFQPDAALRILPEFGGQSRTRDSFIEGAPEFVAEISASSASYDLGEKLKVYRRAGVREHVVWRTWERAIDWFRLQQGQFVLQSPDAQGLHQSQVFPGLWLDLAAMLAGDGVRVLEILQQGLATTEHAQFVEQLKQTRGS